MVCVCVRACVRVCACSVGNTDYQILHEKELKRKLKLRG